jgi:HTH-type transcriptional regulator / antitoxin HipB
MKLLISSPKSLGSALKRQRKAKKLSQTEAGSPFNIEQSTFSTLEQGAPGTRLETLFRVLAALGLEMVIQSKPPPITKNKQKW